MNTNPEQTRDDDGRNDPGRPRLARLSMERLPPWIRIPDETDAAGGLEDK